MRVLILFVAVMLSLNGLFAQQEDKLKTLVDQLGKPEEASKAQEELLDLCLGDASKLWPYLKTVTAPDTLKRLIEVIGGLGDAKSSEHLALLLKHPEPKVRIAVVEALPNYDQAGLALMAPALEDVDLFIAGYASYFYLKNGLQADKSLGILIRALKEISDQESLLQMLQYTALLKRSDLELGKALLTPLAHEDPKIREVAWKAFREGFPKSPDFNYQLSSKADRTKEIIALRGWLNGLVVPGLIEKLQSVGAESETAYQDLKNRGLSILQEIQDQGLAHSNEQVRQKSIRLVTEMASAEQANPIVLKSFLNDKSDIVRLTCLEFLEKSATSEAVTTFEKVLEQEANAKIRERCVYLLIRIDQKRQSLHRILKLLPDDSDENVRLACVLFLEKMEDPSVVPFLSTIPEKDVSWRVRFQSTKALFAPKFESTTQAKERLLALLALTGEDLNKVQEANIWNSAVQLAVEKKVEEAFPLLWGKLGTLRAESLPATFLALQSLSQKIDSAQIESLFPYLRHDSEAVRESAYALMVKHGIESKAFNPKGTPEEREAQLQALEQEWKTLKNWISIKNVLQASSTPSPVEEEQLKQTGESIHPLLLEELSKANDNLASSLIRVLRAHPTEKVLQAMIARANQNPSELVALELAPALNAYSQKEAEAMLMKLLEHSSLVVRDHVVEILSGRAGAGNQLAEKLKELATKATGLSRIRLEIAIFSATKDENRFFQESLKVFSATSEDPKIAEAYQAFLDFAFQAENVAFLNRLLQPEVLKQNGAFRLAVLNQFSPNQRKHLEHLQWNQLLTLLSHEESTVRAATLKCLLSLLGESYGYEPEGTLEARQTAITAFEERWKVQQKSASFEGELAKFQEQLQKGQWSEVKQVLEQKKDQADFYTQIFSFLRSPELSETAKIGFIEVLSGRAYPIEAIHNEFVKTLGDLTSSESTELKRSAILGLRNFSQYGFSTPLTAVFSKLLQDSDRFARFYAVMSLSWSGKPELVLLTLPALADQEERIRIEAASALLVLHPAQAFQQLKPLLQDKHGEVRKLAVSLVLELAKDLSKSSNRLTTKLQAFPAFEKDFQEKGAAFYDDLTHYLTGFYAIMSETERQTVVTLLQEAFSKEQVEGNETQVLIKPLFLKTDAASLAKKLEGLKPLLDREIYADDLAKVLNDESLPIKLDAIRGVAKLKFPSETVKQELFRSLNGDDGIYLQKALDVLGSWMKKELELLPEDQKLSTKYDVNKIAKERTELLEKWRKWRVRTLLERLNPKALEEATKANDTAQVKAISQQMQQAKQFVTAFNEKLTLDVLKETLKAQKGTYASELIALLSGFQQESLQKETEAVLLEILETEREDAIKVESALQVFLTMPGSKQAENLDKLKTWQEASKNELSQVHFAYALQQSGRNQRDFLSKALRSQDKIVRLITINTISSTQDPSLRALLSESLKNEKEEELLLALIQNVSKAELERDISTLIRVGKQSANLGKAVLPLLKEFSKEDHGEDLATWEAWWNAKEKERLLSKIRDLGHSDNDRAYRSLDDLLMEFGEKAIEPLSNTLKDPKATLGEKTQEIPRIRELAIKGIARTAKNARELLEPYLADADVKIQREVIEVLGASGDKAAVASLQKIEETSVNYLYACQARYQLGDETGLPKILATLQSEEARQREMGYGILSRLNIQIEAVVKALAQEKDVGALLLGIQSLEMAKNPIANEVLIASLLHTDRYVRKNASEALNSINKKDFKYDYQKEPDAKNELYQVWVDFEKKRKEQK